MQVTGKVYISIGGQRLRSKEKAKLDTGGAQRDASNSDSGVDGYTEITTAPRVEFALNHTPAISLTDIHAMKDVTLTYETDTGVVFTLVNAWSSTPPSLQGGEVSCVFLAQECIEG